MILLLSAGLGVSSPLIATAAGIEDWIAATDRSDNLLIIEYLRSADYEESVRIIEGVACRSDAYISDILVALLGGFPSAQVYRFQHLARLLLRSMFPPSPPSAGGQMARLAVNREGLVFLASRLNEFLPPLRRESVRLLRASGSAEFDKHLLEQTAWCSQLLNRQQGLADAEQRALILEILEYAEAGANPVFLDPVLRILELTRDSAIAEKARRAARALSGSKTSFPNRAE